mmetsp:Transcript_42459/g.68295  ORF Transcript_42459/g.68295 Transcript_42459/m.68295 type:complete len:559 (+) Transcript_42459:205-1881(+)
MEQMSMEERLALWRRKKNVLKEKNGRTNDVDKVIQQNNLKQQRGCNKENLAQPKQHQKKKQRVSVHTHKNTHLAKVNAKRLEKSNKAPSVRRKPAITKYKGPFPGSNAGDCCDKVEIALQTEISHLYPTSNHGESSIQQLSVSNLGSQTGSLCERVQVALQTETHPTCSTTAQTIEAGVLLAKQLSGSHVGTQAGSLCESVPVGLQTDIPPTCSTASQTMDADVSLVKQLSDFHVGTQTGSLCGGVQVALQTETPLISSTAVQTIEPGVSSVLHAGTQPGSLCEGVQVALQTETPLISSTAVQTIEPRVSSVLHAGTQTDSRREDVQAASQTETPLRCSAATQAMERGSMQLSVVTVGSQACEDAALEAEISSPLVQQFPAWDIDGRADSQSVKVSLEAGCAVQIRQGVELPTTRRDCMKSDVGLQTEQLPVLVPVAAKNVTMAQGGGFLSTHAQTEDMFLCNKCENVSHIPVHIANKQEKDSVDFMMSIYAQKVKELEREIMRLKMCVVTKDEELLSQRVQFNEQIHGVKTTLHTALVETLGRVKELEEELDALKAA